MHCEPAGLTIRMRFAPPGTSEIADETRRLVKSGVLRGVSIGSMPKPGKAKLIGPKDYNSGLLFEAVELYGARSVVSRPIARAW
jgi:phage head maturation protease